jgi:histidyl-tRNA synthetase
MKKADLSGAMYAVIIGEDELRTAEAMVKDLRSSGTQQLVPLDGLLDYVIDLMVNHSD